MRDFTSAVAGGPEAAAADTRTNGRGARVPIGHSDARILISYTHVTKFKYGKTDLSASAIRSGWRGRCGGQVVCRALGLRPPG